MASQEEILLGELDHTSPYPATMACAGRSPTTPPRRSRRRRTPSRIASAPEFQNEPLLPNQVDRLLHIADERGERLANLWRVVFTAGLRSAEARGLRWRDVDLDAGIMRIRHKLEEPTGKPWYFGELKSVRARREIALIDQSRQAL